MKPLRDYIRAIQRNLATGVATERTYYPALRGLLETLDEDVMAINEAKRIECGAPDFIVIKGPVNIGCIEAKDVEVNLDSEEESEQMLRYRDSLSNLILTDFLEFRWYVDGERRLVERLGRVTRDNKIKADTAGIEAVRELLSNFLAHRAEPIGTAKDLAVRMAGQAHMIRDLIVAAFEREPESGRLRAQFKAFEEQLIPDLSLEEFADMYAQTITYGLFAARCTWDGRGEFTRKNAAYLIPKTNPFLRGLFDHIAGIRLDDRIAWLVDFLAQLLAQADMEAILKDFGKRTGKEDPVVHFYETFLRAYDPATKVTRGIFYTADPVVSYIVRSIDYLLKTHFDKAQGLADANVLILDPAAGTGTFLYHVVQEIYEWLVTKGQKGLWDGYVAERLLPRIFGFELLMAPYAMAHLKLGLLLKETGYEFHGDQRLGIYLTNALEAPLEKYEAMGFGRFIGEEGNEAAKIKREEPIMVVLGNPPYSVSSANKGEHIEKLMERYKKAVKEERNIQPLSDDYIKFIRFAHDRIERTGYGIIGMITNHTYLSGLIHRGMREELMKSFSNVYILDLHGSALLGETPPDGGKDENVFDIRQGVAISLFIRKPEHKGVAKVYHADLWGLREHKNSYLTQKDVRTTEWRELKPAPDYFFFVRRELELAEEYRLGWSAADSFIFGKVGITSGDDQFFYSYTSTELKHKVEQVKRKGYERKSQVHDDINNYIHEATLSRAISCTYRPFDTVLCLFHRQMLWRPVADLAAHLTRRRNLGFITLRRTREASRNHFFVTSYHTDKAVISSRDNAYVFPLYLYPDDEGAQKKLEPEEGRRPNLNPEFIKALEENLSLQFIPDGRGDLKETFGPEDVFYYAYAVFHSPTYRTRYEEFFKIDFPRLPLTSDRRLFAALVEKGAELVALHLMESPTLETPIIGYPIRGSNKVEKVRYVEPHKEAGEEIPGRVYINKEQYYDGVEPDVWTFHIGGYQVLHKWLKDRRGRKLSIDDLEHYQKIVVVLKETMRLMEEIDTLIPTWPLG